MLTPGGIYVTVSAHWDNGGPRADDNSKLDGAADATNSKAADDNLILEETGNNLEQHEAVELLNFKADDNFQLEEVNLRGRTDSPFLADDTLHHCERADDKIKSEEINQTWRGDVTGDLSVTLILCRNFGKEVKGNHVIDRPGKTDAITVRGCERQSDVVITCDIDQYDVLEVLDAQHTKHLHIIDHQDIEVTAYKELIVRLAHFQPQYLSDVSFQMADDTRMVAIDNQCAETFDMVFKGLHNKDDSMTSHKEEHVPLLNTNIDQVDIIEGNVSVGDQIFSGFRKIAQLVMDTLISVKTEDEDVLPYGEAT